LNETNSELFPAFSTVEVALEFATVIDAAGVISSLAAETEVASVGLLCSSVPLALTLKSRTQVFVATFG
jgi:hypothetical protein